MFRYIFLDFECWRFINFLAEEMDQADEELRKTIMKIWPLQSKKMIDLLVPQKEGNTLMRLKKKLLMLNL